METKKKSKLPTIIVSILLFVLGLVVLFQPVGTMFLVSWLFVVALLIFGVWQIIKYIVTPKESKNGGQLTSGILSVLLVVLIAPFNGEAGLLGSFLTVMFMLGFTSISSGIGRLMMAGELKRSGTAGTGWITFSGILSIILGVFCISNPLFMGIYQGIMFGIFLIVTAIVLFSASMSGE